MTENIVPKSVSLETIRNLTTDQLISELDTVHDAKEVWHKLREKYITRLREAESVVLYLEQTEVEMKAEHMRKTLKNEQERNN